MIAWALDLRKKVTDIAAPEMSPLADGDEIAMQQQLGLANELDEEDGAAPATHSGHVLPDVLQLQHYMAGNGWTESDTFSALLGGGSYVFNRTHGAIGRIAAYLVRPEPLPLTRAPRAPPTHTRTPSPVSQRLLICAADRDRVAAL